MHQLALFVLVLAVSVRFSPSSRIFCLQIRGSSTTFAITSVQYNLYIFTYSVRASATAALSRRRARLASNLLTTIAFFSSCVAACFSSVRNLKFSHGAVSSIPGLAHHQPMTASLLRADSSLFLSGSGGGSAAATTATEATQQASQ